MAKYLSLFPNWDQFSDMSDSRMIFKCNTFFEETEILCDIPTGLRFTWDDEIPGSPCCSEKCRERQLQNANVVELEVELEPVEVLPI